MEPGKFTKIALVVVGLVGGALFLINLYSGYRKLHRSAQAEAAAPSMEQLRRPAPDFTLTDSSGKTMRLADLRGKVWAASFIFTHCHGPCPQITRHMAELQARIADLPGARLVSISIDPARDTPEVLKAYAARFQADESRWHFLTGPEAEIKRVVQEGFLTALQPVEGSDQIVHGTMVALVDRTGTIRGFLSGTDPEVGEQAAGRLRALHQEP